MASSLTHELTFSTACIVLANHEAFLVETDQNLVESRATFTLQCVASELQNAVHQITAIFKFFARNDLIECIPLGV